MSSNPYGFYRIRLELDHGIDARDPNIEGLVRRFATSVAKGNDDTALYAAAEILARPEAPGSKQRLVAYIGFLDEESGSDRGGPVSEPQIPAIPARVDVAAADAQKTAIEPLQICAKHGGDPLPLSVFPKHPRSKNGRHPWCKTCLGEASKSNHRKKREPAPAGLKWCPRCKGEPKPMEDFAKSKTTTDGRQAWCRQCQRDYRKENPRKKAVPAEANGRRNEPREDLSDEDESVLETEIETSELQLINEAEAPPARDDVKKDSAGATIPCGFCGVPKLLKEFPTINGRRSRNCNFCVGELRRTQSHSGALERT